MSEALLSFSLTPVQSFIEAARSVRDLKAGSALLSHLTWQALVAANRAGGSPLFPAVDPQGDEPQSIPNLFLMRFGTATEAHKAEQRAEEAVRERWNEIGNRVHDTLDAQWQPRWDSDWGPHGWDSDWDTQIKGFWTVTTVVLDSDDAARIYKQITGKTSAPDLATQFKVISALLAARKMVRRFPADHGIGRHKCSILGDLEQMGPVGLGSAREFWRAVTARGYQRGDGEGRIYLSSRDRLCAVSLVKRFCAWYDELNELLPPLGEERAQDWRGGYIPETAEVAARHWWDDAPEGKRKAFAQEYEGLRAKCQAPETMWRCLLVDSLTPKTVCEDAQSPLTQGDLAPLVDARGKLLSAAREEGLGPPPRYYAILVQDGDHMGKWLNGEMSKEPVTEEYWNEVSARLRGYAGNRVPATVRDHGGYLVYAGGDDALALLPLAAALKCARQLRNEFPDFPRDEGSDPPTASAGLAIAHYQDDLRAVLRAAREAERAAKNAGRDRLGIVVLKRSGAPVELVLDWGERHDQVDDLLTLQSLFEKRLSDRWLYHLAKTHGDLAPDPEATGEDRPDLPAEAVERLLAHSVKRTDIPEEARDKLTGDLWDQLSKHRAPEKAEEALREYVVGLFSCLRDMWRAAEGEHLSEGDLLTRLQTPGHAANDIAEGEHLSEGDLLKRFIDFGMIASFLQRGRD